MKKIISLFLSVCMLLSMSVFVSAVEFSDLSADHWAYSSIKALVDEGTINGYEDGTFKPSKTVTRAEFAKMIGKWDRRYALEYEDLNQNHWAYEFIIWSGLDSIDGKISPDVAITRADVINLIWKRNGSPKHNLAPAAIAKQGTNADAASWAYTIGLMKGDDGFNLRLDDSLSRAEAATLILRSRDLVAKNQNTNYVDNVSDSLLKVTFETLDYLGEEYNSAKKLTYGELAKIAVTFGNDGDDKFAGTDLEGYKALGHKYDKEMYTISSQIWGKSYYTASKIDQPATKQDAITAIMYGFLRRGTAPILMGQMNDFYPDVKDANSTTWENMFLTYAYQNGIKLKASDNLGASEMITEREFTALLLLFNDLDGLGVKYEDGYKASEKIITNEAQLTQNFKDFKHTIKGVPQEVYRLKQDGVVAKDSYKTSVVLHNTFSGFLSGLSTFIKSNTGAKLSYSYYPSLCYSKSKSVIITAKFVVTDCDKDTIYIDELFGSVLKEKTGYTVRKNQEFYVVFETYEPLLSLSLSHDEAYIKAIYID